MKNVFVRMMALCTRHPWAVILVSAALTVASVWFVATHFRIDTDINGLIDKDLPWRKRELAVQRAFPQTTQLIIAVIEADTPEAVGAASRAFVTELNKSPDRFRAVQEIGGGSFFDRYGLLFLPVEQLKTTMEQLKSAVPNISVLTADPSIRGLVDAFSQALGPAQDGVFEDLPQNLNRLALPIEDVLAGRPAAFSWRAYLSGKPASAAELRRLITIWPKLDFSALQPGLAGTTAVREAAVRAKLGDFGAKLKITGAVPIADEEFATLQKGAVLNGIVTGVLVLLILFLALRSVKIVVAVSITLGVGLVMAAAVGILAVGSYHLVFNGVFDGAFNPISLAFAVLFIGLGADFAIQFSVRYRAERNLTNDLREGLMRAAGHVGAPLTLAAAAAAAGFMSFLPTTYVGMAELGLIAGVGMGVAYLAAMILLPALLQVFDPPPELEPLGYKFMAPIDRFLARHRIAVVGLTTLVAVIGGAIVFTPTWLVSAAVDHTPFLSRDLAAKIKRLSARSQLRFDFDPLHLRNQDEEAVATYRELTRDPSMTTDTMQVLAKSPEDVPAIIGKLKALPEVGDVRSIETFVPQLQDEKLAIIRAALKQIEPAMKPQDLNNAATDAANIAALKTGAANLKLIAEAHPGCDAVDGCIGSRAALRLAEDLEKLAAASPEVRKTAEAVMIRPLAWDLEQLQISLQPRKFTRADLPKPIIESWIAADGRARVEVLPSRKPARDPRTNRAYTHNQIVKNFAEAVLRVEPEATGAAIGAFEWGDTIKTAFLYAAIISLVSIAIILYIVLRRITDVLVTLIPLLVAALVTLEICGIRSFPLNYANIIALPVLLGVGVAFKIYYVTAWRAGETEFLQSPLTRAVFYSALMTAVAFGSLSFSSHPGTASMGKLLALSLACTLASAALFQPALMGSPRKKAAPH